MCRTENLDIPEGVEWITQQCRELGKREDTPADVRDALYFYYLAFMEISRNAPAFREPALPRGGLWVTNLEWLYPDDTRAFTAWDLPDLTHLLKDIPLRGEDREPTVPMTQLMSKCMPFCCQQRSLVQYVSELITTDDACWRVLSAVAWCALAGMYPSTVVRKWKWSRLHAIHKLTHDKRAFLTALGRTWLPRTRANTSETNQNCYFILTMIRRWIIFMVQGDEHYQASARQHFDWDAFVQETLARYECLQQLTVVGEQDVFAGVREMARQKRWPWKTQSMGVNRYRTTEIIPSIAEKTMTILKKTLLKEVEATRNDRSIVQDMIHKEQFSATTLLQLEQNTLLPSPTIATCGDGGGGKEIRHPSDVVAILQTADQMLRALEDGPPAEIRQNIFNYCLRVPEQDRLTPLALAGMTLPHLGGISHVAATIAYNLTLVYHESAKPKDYRIQVEMLSVIEFKTITWYFYVLSILDQIHLVPLTQDQVDAIDRAMLMVRQCGVPGIPVPRYSYDVFIKICCGHLVTMEGQRGFGHANMAYSTEKSMFVCTKGQKDVELMDPATVIDSIETDVIFGDAQSTVRQRQMARNRRKIFTEIPCEGNPVLQICLRGFMLVFQHRRYMHCPRCASFHEFHWKNFAGSPDGRYRCPECQDQEVHTGRVKQCAKCRVSLTDATAYTQIDIDTHEERSDPGRARQRRYYCGKHKMI